MKSLGIIGLGSALLLLASAAPSRATTLFSEDFSGATPGNYAGAIPGSQFTVTSSNVDVIGVLNGNSFNCVANPAGNCLDLVGGNGAGAIASVPTFSLVAGNTYTVSFTANLQGFGPGSGSTTFDVGLGSLSQQEILAGDITTPYAIDFTPGTDESGAELTFTTIVPGDGVHGAVISGITVNETSVAAVPEPGSLALLAGAIGGLVLLARPRRLPPPRGC